MLLKIFLAGNLIKPKASLFIGFGPPNVRAFLFLLTICMTTENHSDQPNVRRKAPSRGGARKGAGRPVGSTNKIRIEELMTTIHTTAGRPYGELLAQNYVQAIAREDWNGVRDYDKAFMNKMIADKTEVTTVDSADTVAQKSAAFAEAIAQIAGIAKKH